MSPRSPIISQTERGFCPSAKHATFRWLERIHALVRLAGAVLMVLFQAASSSSCKGCLVGPVERFSSRSAVGFPRQLEFWFTVCT